MRVGERKCLKSLFDPFMDKREPLFEAQHFLTDDLEPEVAGLDDARVHGSDCDFMHAVAADADKPVVLLTRLPFRRRLEIVSQRKAIDRPCRLPCPGTL